MQRIREQQQARRKVWRLCRQHGGLPAAVGMASEKHLAGEAAAQQEHRARKARAILRGHRGEGRTMWPRLAERQIAAEHGHARHGEGIRHRDEQGRAGVRSRTVRQHQAVTYGRIGRVQESAHGGGFLRVFEGGDGGH